MIQLAVDQWFAARDQGHQPVLLAGTNEVVDALNTAVRRDLVAQGRLPVGPALAWGEKDFVLGDRVGVRRNSYQERCLDGSDTVLLNGEIGTVIDGGPYGLAVSMDADGRTVAVRGQYLAEGHLDYAYALTTTRAQGGTWDVAIGVGLDGLYREAGYTQLSRGSASNLIVLTEGELEDLDNELERHDQGLPLTDETPAHEELRRTLERSGAKTLALRRDPDAGSIAELADTPLAPLEERARFCRHVEQQAARAIGADPRNWPPGSPGRATPPSSWPKGQTVKVYDRQNIGTVTGYDDTTGIVDVHFISADGQRRATRTFDWSEIEILDRHPELRALTEEGRAALNALVEPLQDQLNQIHTHMAAQGVRPDEAEHHERAATLAIDRASRHLTYQQPDWLRAILSQRPTTPAAASVWDDAVRHVAAYRLRNDIPTDVPELGEAPPSGSAERSGWEDSRTRLARDRIWLDTHHPRPALPLSPTRSREELEARREQLDEIFATAPDDQRELIECLRSGDLSSQKTIRLLEEALDTQDARRQWIITNWPHVVEHAEVTRTLDAGLAGPDTDILIPSLRERNGPLADATEADERWLRTAVSRLAGPEAQELDAETLDLLEAIADYRSRWNISENDILGHGAETGEQATERIRLTRWIEEVTPPAPEPPDAPGKGEQLELAFQTEQRPPSGLSL